MAKKASKKPKVDPYLQPAQDASLVRYGPELSSLTALLRAAETSYADRVRQAQSARQFTVSAVDQGVPQVAKAYQGAQAAVQPAFAQQGGVEASALQARLGESGALAQSQLAARRVSAVEGQGALGDQALRDLRTDRGKIGDRSTSLAQEMGAFTAQSMSEARGADSAAKLAMDKLNAQLTQSDINNQRTTGTSTANNIRTTDATKAAADARAQAQTQAKAQKKWASPERQAAVSAQLDPAVKWASAVKARKTRNDRATAEKVLANGVEAAPAKVLYDELGNARIEPPKLPNGKPNPLAGQRMMTPADPGIPEVKSKLLRTAALDMAYDGHLSRLTQRLLQANGIKLKPLGLVTFGEWLKTPAGQAWKRAQNQPTYNDRIRAGQVAGPIAP